jgi:two-component system phosphate regulon sensor histidine kinase PhoR
MGTMKMILEERIHRLLLALYGVVAFLAVWGLWSRTADPERLPAGSWAAIGAVSAIGAILEVLMRMRTRKALKLMETQIKKMSDDSQVGMVMVEDDQPVANLASILNHYLTTLRTELDELSLQHRELDLQILAVDAEKQNTEAVIKSISDAVMVLNAFGEPILVNRLAEELFGFTIESDAKVYRTADELIAVPQILELIEQARMGAAQPIRKEIRIVDPAGADRCFKTTVCPVRVRGEALWAIVMILHDVTQERELAEMKNEFVNHVSHELRTPLCSIKAYVQDLIEDEHKAAAERTEFYRIISNEADRLQRFIDNILNLSCIESGLMPVCPVAINLADALPEVIRLIQPSAQEKNICVEVEIAENLEVWADIDLFRQAVLNLLSNAVKYTSNGGKVILRAPPIDEENVCRITVIDTGIGIADHDRELVFDKFYRAKSGSTMAGGSGLGLALAKKIVEDLHGGKLHLESCPGKGSIFTIELPRRAPVDAGQKEADTLVPALGTEQ